MSTNRNGCRRKISPLQHHTFISARSPFLFLRIAGGHQGESAVLSVFAHRRVLLTRQDFFKDESLPTRRPPQETRGSVCHLPLSERLVAHWEGEVRGQILEKGGQVPEEKITFNSRSLIRREGSNSGLPRENVWQSLIHTGKDLSKNPAWAKPS